MGRIHLHFGYQQALKKSPNQKKLLIGDFQSIIITFVNSVVIRDLKSRLAPTHVGAFLLSLHFRLSRHLDQELYFIPPTLNSRKQLFQTRLLTENCQVVEPARPNNFFQNGVLDSIKSNC